MLLLRNYINLDRNEETIINHIIAQLKCQVRGVLELRYYGNESHYFSLGSRIKK